MILTETKMNLNNISAKIFLELNELSNERILLTILPTKNCDSEFPK